MNSSIKLLVKNASIYGAGDIILKVFNLAIVPVFTRVFTPNEYGIIDMASLYGSILLIIMTWGIDSGIIAYKNEDKQKGVYRNALIFITFINILFTFILLPFNGLISTLLFGTKDYGWIVVVYTAISYFSVFIYIVKVILRLEFLSIKFQIIALSNGIITICLSLIGVLIYKKGLQGYFNAILIANFIAFITSIVLVKDKIKLSIDFKTIKSMMVYGLPLSLTSLLLLLNNSLDRIFISNMCSFEQLGLYNIANKLGLALGMIITWFQMPWPAFAMKIYDEDKNYKKIIDKITITMVAGASFIGIGLTLLSPYLLIVLTGKSFVNAYILLGPICINLIAGLMSNILIMGAVFLKNTKLVLPFNLVVIGFNFALEFILVERFKYLGAAYASALAQLLLTVLWYWASNYKYKVLKIDVYKIIVIITLLLGLTSLNLIIGYDKLMYFAIRIVAILLFPLLLFLLGVLKVSTFLQHLKLLRKKF